MSASDQEPLHEPELSFARLPELMQHAPAFVVVLLGSEHVIEHVNEEFLRMFGSRELRGLPMALALPEAVSQGFVALLDRAYRSGQLHIERDVSLPVRAQAGAAAHQRCVDVILQPLIESPRGVTGLLVQGVDATERRRAEAELQSTRERVQLATSAAGLGVWRWEIRNDRGHWENERGSEIVGLPPGTQAPSNAAFIADILHPDDVLAFQAHLARAVAERGRLHYVGRIRRQNDQALRWVEMIGSFHAGSGIQPDCLVGTVADITERQEAQAQMLASEERYRRLVESMDEGFCVIEVIFDADGLARDYRFMETNRVFAEQTGLHDAVGRCVLDMVPELERHWVEAYGQVVRTGQPLRFMQHSPAMGRWFNVYASPTGAPGSHRVALLFTDVTEQKTSEVQMRQLASELAEAHERKNRFLATLAHELRNPLAPLRNGLALIRSGAGNDALVQVAREMMDRQLTQLTTLVGDLLDVARSQSGKLELKRALVALEPIVRTAVETSLPHIEAAGHQLQLRLPETPVWLDADPTRLAQVLNNLLDNAAKYTPSRGRIEVAAFREGEELVLTVSDNGAGMSQELIGTVFEMFSQGSAAHVQSPGGLGIGLALVRDLVRLHGGSVSAHSDGPGRGSLFAVRLPLPATTAENMPKPDAAGASSHGQPTVPWRVLVADDNADAGESLALLLQLSGHVTALARDGLEAVSLVASFRPEMLILDIGMPGLNGYEVAKMLRADRQHEALVLVALTGRGAVEDHARSSRAGFDLHLTKPADPNALLTFMQSISQRRAARQASGEGSEGI